MLGDLRGEVMVFSPLTVKELSVSGATVETQFPLNLDTLHDMRLALGPTTVVLKGRVVHARVSTVDHDVVTYTSGIEFVQMSERVRLVISEFLDGIRLSRRQL